MAQHYSELDFLFGTVNKYSITQNLDNTSNRNTTNIFKGAPTYVVYKSNKNIGVDSGTNNIINYLRNGNGTRTGIYKNESSGKNPYIKLLEDFNSNEGTPGAGLKLRAADLAYLRDLGVYPLNRMAILRRFREGTFVYENLEEMTTEPISTIVGWIKFDQSFGKIDFNETWGTTDKRFDIKLTEIISQNFGIPVSSLIPIPDFAQGVLFQFYKNVGLLNSSGVDDSINETYEHYDANKVGAAAGTGAATWGLNSIPVGDPNVLQEGPFRNPVGQNIKSAFSFDLETTYEQKLIGDVDPGSAMLDILDNIYAMGTSDMVFYWGDAAPSIVAARNAASEKANNLNSWWIFVSSIMKSFWKEIKDMFNGVYEKTKEIAGNVNENLQSKGAGGAATAFIDNISGLLSSILTSTIAIHRFELRGSIELMTGGKVSSTPWYLTLGNPYSPWLSTNHIVVKSCSVESSSEMGFNDQPQRLTVKFTCEFSRSLGKQELMRMFNNTYRRTYAAPPGNLSNIKAKVFEDQSNIISGSPDRNVVDPRENLPGQNKSFFEGSKLTANIPKISQEQRQTLASHENEMNTGTNTIINSNDSNDNYFRTYFQQKNI